MLKQFQMIAEGFVTFSQAVWETLTSTIRDLDLPTAVSVILPDWILDTSLIVLIAGAGIVSVIVYSLVKWIVGIVTGS